MVPQARLLTICLHIGVSSLNICNLLAMYVEAKPECLQSAHTQEPQAWEFEIDPEDLDYEGGQRLGQGSYGGECESLQGLAKKRVKVHVYT